MDLIRKLENWQESEYSNVFLYCLIDAVLLLLKWLKKNL